jgi:FlaG/FlaF family flagellin (archaellin)
MNSEGVSSVVATILMLGIIVTVISVLNAYYFPSIAAESEIEHMQNVQERFFMIAAKIRSGETATVEIPLGSGTVPVVSSLSSSGAVIVSNAGSMNITLTNATFNESYNGSGSLKFSSSNNYWLNQEYIFEDGAVILKQHNKTLMRLTPFEMNSEIRINLFTIEKNDSIAGNGVQGVKIIINERDDLYFQGIENITALVDSENPGAWQTYFIENGWSLDTPNPNNEVRATFNLNNKTVILKIIKLNIDLQ